MSKHALCGALTPGIAWHRCWVMGVLEPQAAEHVNVCSFSARYVMHDSGWPVFSPLDLSLEVRAGDLGMTFWSSLAWSLDQFHTLSAIWGHLYGGCLDDRCQHRRFTNLDSPHRPRGAHRQEPRPVVPRHPSAFGTFGRDLGRPPLPGGVAPSSVQIVLVGSHSSQLRQTGQMIQEQSVGRSGKENGRPVPVGCWELDQRSTK